MSEYLILLFRAGSKEEVSLRLLLELLVPHVGLDPKGKVFSLVLFRVQHVHFVNDLKRYRS